MARVYRTKSFNPTVSGSNANPDQIAKLLGEAIGQVVSDGWVYQGMDTVRITVKPGCLAVFSGPRVEHHDILVFYRDV